MEVKYNEVHTRIKSQILNPFIEPACIGLKIFKIVLISLC